MKTQEETVIDASQNQLYYFKEIWRYRELFYFFAWRDIKVKYKQTILGFAWAILQPVIMMIIFTFFFSRALNIPSESIPYPVYVLSGLILWNVFSTGLTGASSSMLNSAPIIKKIYFPRLVIPASSILTALFDFLMSLIPFTIVMIYFSQKVSISAVWCWPLSLLTCSFATLGLGSWAAALSVKYRDFRYVIPFLIQILFFVSPVIYPVSMLKYPVLQYLLVLSPMYASLELFRLPLTGLPINDLFLMISMASSVLFLVIGFYYFTHTEKYFADLA